MRYSVEVLLAVGLCTPACQGSLDLDRFSFDPRAPGVGGAGGTSVDGSGGSAGNGGSNDVGGNAGSGVAGNPPGAGSGGSGGEPPAPNEAVAVFDHYRFARDGVTFSVGAEAGLLANDVGALTVQAGALTTERGGNVDVAADGGFTYTPAINEWGDDFFEYTLLESQSRARVRLTLSPGTVLLSDVTGAAHNGFVILGGAMAAGVGGVTAGGGDINGDGRADLLIGTSGGGTAYAVFGKSDAAPLASAALGGAGFAIEASATYPGAGYSLADAGDVNGDGLDDLLVGTASFNLDGAAYVVFGKSTGETVLLGDLENALGGGFAMRGANVGDSVGLAVSGAGDVNGDGLADVILGAPGAGAGTAYVVFGKTTPDPFSLGVLDGGLDGGFAILGPAASTGAADAVAGVGDVNGDGLADVALTARGAATSIAYVVFGKRDTASVSLDALAGKGYAISDGVAVGGGGLAIAGAGDVDADGLADLVLGKDDVDPSLAGAAYVVFGQAGDGVVDLGAVKAGTGAGFVIHGGDELDNAGRSVAGPGDLDGDGFADLLIGAENAAPGGGAASGKAYVVWGKPSRAAVLLSAVGNESGGFALQGANEQDFAGSGVAGAGDLDRDGLLDLLIGTRGADVLAAEAGAAHVLFGWDASDALGARDLALYGTSGDDTLSFDGRPLISAAAGNGIDTLTFSGSDISLDLSDRALRVESIEIVDIRGSGPNRLRLDDAAVRRLPQTRPGLPAGLAKTLIVLADADDELRFDASGYDLIGSNAGRDVYRKLDSFYGVEISPGVTLSSP
jgi:hypothetical protein